MTIPKAPVGLLTVDQVAELLQFSPDTIIDLIRSGQLPRFALSDRDRGPGKKGPGRRGYRVHPDDLAAFVAARCRSEVPREATATTPAATPPRVAYPIATGTDGISRLRRPKG